MEGLPQLYLIRPISQGGLAHLSDHPTDFHPEAEDVLAAFCEPGISLLGVEETLLLPQYSARHINLACSFLRYAHHKCNFVYTESSTICTLPT